MSLASDRRGRVPFALVGVLLLVGASVYATGLADRTQPAIERPAEEAMDDVSRDTRPALRAAVGDAARDAARAPVTDPADTAAGRALNASDPFLDALRLRIAAAAREELSVISREQDGVRASVSLPKVDGSTASFRRAKRGIEVTPADDGASMRVTVRNLTVRAESDGRVVAERGMNVSLTVATPVLALHQRTQRYEDRLNRGALEGPGLSRGLTTRLTAVAMARGNGRYAGAPIQNVLGNRHVELSTNAALLAQQRAAFGREDPDGSRALAVATVKVGVEDVLAGRQSPASDWAQTVLSPNDFDDDAAGRTEDGFDPEKPDSPPVNASPAATADEVYLDRSDETETAGSYRVQSHLRAAVLRRTITSRPEPRLENWHLVTEQTSHRTVVESVDRGSATESAGAAVDTVRKVTTHHTVKRRWFRNGSFRTTTAQWTESARVTVRVTAEYAPDDAAPTRPTEPLFERGGALDGPNLAGARERAAEALLGSAGGVDHIAEKTAAGDRGFNTLTRRQNVTATRPEELDEWIAADRRELRQAVANISITIPREVIASGKANAPAQLAAAVRTRRAALIDAPATYDGAADRARVAARAAYVDRVIAALETRAAETRSRNVDYRDELGSRVTGSVPELVDIGRDTESRERSANDYETGGTIGGGDLRITPDGSPAYLTLQSVGHEQVPSVPVGNSTHPLTARTTNWVALPYGDAADGLVETLFSGGPRQVSLGAAAGTLIAANRTANREGDDEATGSETDPATTALAANREALTVAVRDSVRTAERGVCDTATDGTTVSQATCQAAVVDVRDRWPTLGHRAQAMANGSYAGAFSETLAAHGVAPGVADEAGVRARVRLRELGDERTTSVPAETTNQTASAVQQVATEIARQHASSVLENASRRASQRLTGASRLPAGVPVAPPPYSWVASVNAWSVTVRGEYQRFAVRASGNTPDGGGATVRYVRDGSTVRLDADGDGAAERLGTNERVGFEASTTVVAVVPPGPPGIGDVDGNRDEQSAGWPCPGIDDRRQACTAASDPE